jgi:type IV pilus assembly protein PilO
MADLIDSLAGRPQSHLIAGWVGSILFIVFFSYYFLLSSSLSEIYETQERVTKLESDVAEAKIKKKHLKYLQELKGKLEDRVSAAEKELPEKEEMGRLLSTLSGLAKSAGLDIQLWKKESEIAKDFYVELPVSVEVLGTYHQVATFFDEVGRLDRIVNIAKISMENPVPGVPGSMKVKTACTVTTFRQLTAEEKKKLEEEKDAKLKGGRGRRE